MCVYCNRVYTLFMQYRCNISNVGTVSLRIRFVHQHMQQSVWMFHFNWSAHFQPPATSIIIISKLVSMFPDVGCVSLFITLIHCQLYPRYHQHISDCLVNECVRCKVYDSVMFATAVVVAVYTSVTYNIISSSNTTCSWPKVLTEGQRKTNRGYNFKYFYFLFKVFFQLFFHLQ